MAHKACLHDPAAIQFHLNVQHFGNTNLKYLEIKGECGHCGSALRFRGPVGVSTQQPMVSMDGSEAVNPFLFESESYDGNAVGYSVSAAGND